MQHSRTPCRSWGLLLALALVAGGGAPAPAFDGERAYRDLVELVRIGPRPAGSPGAAAARELIGERLRQAGWRVDEHPLRVEVDGQGIDMTNLIGVMPGERPGLVLIGTHYDTKRLPGFVGANDGASGVAVLLELARTLGDAPRPYTVWLVFFDGEEALGAGITANDGLFGSRALARQMQREGDLEKIRGFLLVDMVGDRDLGLTEDVGSTPALRQALVEEAARLGLEDVLGGGSVALIDDHTPFQALGVEPVLALIDFRFGGDSMPGPLWHTTGDDLSAVSAESLNSVGRLLVEVLRRVERETVAREGVEGAR
ncbi:MAG: M28 family peptidase [Deltaproteobacteria bacterium]|nr:M28 family peptidase [Deltaproteobacteria bacterium]MBW2412910.1 M28 family peptidase [Deltaproteobacteria bacterium]